MYISKSVLVALAFTLLVGVFFGLMIASNFDFSAESRATLSQPNRPVELGGATPPIVMSNDQWAVGKAFVQVAKRVIPSVVSITSEKVVKSRLSFPDFFHPWWGRDPERSDKDQPNRRQHGLGSGVLISKEGYIVTNNHVITDADEIFVLMDNDRYPAKIIGADPSTDLAVIKIDVPDKPLSVIALGNSDELEVGEWVMAVGNPFSIWLQHSVTAGIVSGKGRVNVGIREIEYQDFIQTDAAINPGNSGGALVNLRGELVGINTAIYSNGFNGGNVGIGFAIPVNLVKYVSKELIENGKVVRGWLGVEIRPLDKETAESLGLTRTEGALVSGLQKGPARKAGIKPNDVIIEFAGIKVKDHNHLMHLVAVHKPGETVSLKLIHKGEVKQISVKLGERPEREALAVKETPNRPELGIEVETLTPDLAFRFDLKEKEGVVVVRVEPGSQAEDEGISPGDVIVAVNKVKVRSTEEFFRQIEKAQRKGVVLLRLSRRGSKYFVALDLNR